MDTFEELNRKLTMIEARVASYERLHAEEISELKAMLEALKMRQVTLQSRVAQEAASRVDAGERGGSSADSAAAESASDKQRRSSNDE